MILFSEDYYKQPYYIQNTTNKSFIKMHLLLKRMGIKNNTFFLACTQKELLNIDPHDEKKITPELAMKIALECKINPWYYFREIVRMPSQGGDSVPFILNRANLALIWTFLNGTNIYLVQPRQTGKTISTQAIASWIMFIGTKNFTMAMYTKDNKLREENVSRLKYIKEELPTYLTHFNKLEDTTNKQTIRYATLNTKYDTYVAQSDIMGADTIGRGATVSVAHIDESEFFENLNVTYPVLSGTMTRAIAQAREAGLPNGVIITTTAGRLEAESCQYCMGMIDRCVPFTESFYDCKNKKELDELISMNSTNKMVYAQFSYLQLGLTDEWLHDAIARSNATRDAILREYLCIRTSGVDNSVIPLHLLEKIKASMKDPVHIQTVNSRYIFKWYVKPEEVLNNKNTTIVMGLDTSENIGKDFTSLVMLDARDMSVICTARCNEADLIRLALYIGEFMSKYSNTFLVPERKSTASMMIALICSELRKNGINPWTRIYNGIVQNKDNKEFLEVDLSDITLEDSAYKKYLGFTTTGFGDTSRNALYSNTLMKTVELNYSRMHDTTLITELSSLAQKNGRIDHSASGHDDTVISYLLGCWFIFFAKNINYYNINKNIFLNEIGADGSKINTQEKERQNAILQQIVELKKEIKRLGQTTYVLPLERELKHLESLLDPDMIDTTPISQEQVKVNSNKNKHTDFTKLANLYFR